MPAGGCASGESGAEEIPRSDLACGDLACGEVAGFSGNIGESQEGRGITKGLRGGYTCCVPGCYSNTKKCGLLDIPIVFPLLPQPKARKEPKLREYVPPPKKNEKGRFSNT